MLFDLFSGGFNIDLVIKLCARVFVLFCVLPIHEFAHAITAHWLGDDTARLKGRLTTNPLAHIDMLGALMIILVGFGYAKPVPVNIRNFKHRKRDMAITALAGPLSNIICAFVLLFGMGAVIKFATPEYGSTMYFLSIFFNYAASVNISLAVFNMLPIPPLDGSRLWNIIIPNKYYYKIMQYERYIIFAVFFLIIFGFLDMPIAYATSSVHSFLLKIVTSILGIQFGA